MTSAAVAVGLLLAVSVAACDDRDAPTPPAVTVRITLTPERAATLQNTQVRFMATVTGTTDTGVVWSLDEGATGGAIAADGTYTAPGSHGMFHVRATSRADAVATATATIEVTNVFPIIDGTLGATGVHGSASNDVWVVEEGRHRHWDGGTWTQTPVATRSGNFPLVLEAVWANGPEDVFEAGTGDLGLELRHWNGTRWTSFTPPLGGFVFGLWGTGPSNVWALGASPLPTIHHWDGAAWSGERPQATVGKASSLGAAWGATPDDVWAVGLGDESGGNSRGAAVFRWNGSTWTQFRSGLTGSLLSIWGSAANDIWTVGAEGFLAHWDGQAWTPIPSGTTRTLWSVFGFAANDVWTAGEGGVILHWDGSNWSQFPSPTTTNFRGVWGAAPNDLWLVGHDAIVHLP